LINEEKALESEKISRKNRVVKSLTASDDAKYQSKSLNALREKVMKINDMVEYLVKNEYQNVNFREIALMMKG